jgi:hypothetical protein
VRGGKIYLVLPGFYKKTTPSGDKTVSGCPEFGDM